MTASAMADFEQASTDERLRTAVIDACRELTRRGLTHGTSGNVSVRRDQRQFFVSPTGMAYERLVPDDVPLVDLDGRWFGHRAPSSEWRFHRDIFAARAEVRAIIHTHSPHATSLACTERSIPAFHYMVAVAGGPDIRCAPYHTFGTQALSNAALAALEGRRACLLANHGVIAVGADLEAALALAGEVENLARQYSAALALGDVRILDSEEMRRVIERFRTYGGPDACDADLECAGAALPQRTSAEKGDASDRYPLLDPTSAGDYAAALAPVRERLGASREKWRVREVGDGNLNLVFIVEGPEGSVCIKQALPYVRVAGPSWPMTPERAFFEYSYYETVAPHVGALIPQILHYDPRLHCLTMERLAPHIILRRGLVEGRRYPDLGRALGEYVARASFFTSDLAAPFERKMQSMALFARNTPLVRITVDLVFTDPYRTSPRNRHTSPELDAAVADLRSDGALKAAAAHFGHKFLAAPQALIHGDLHSGSVMVTPEDSRVIDPEFAFYGPIGFDLGAFFGNLLLAWYAQPGHETSDGERARYRDWILDEAQHFWESFQRHFLALWQENGRGDAYPASMFPNAADAAPLGAARRAFIDALFADMLAFAACKMIRRIVGFAHVLDFESIADRRVRARCESGALAIARRLLTEPERFGSIGEVIEAVRGSALRSGSANAR